MEPGGVEQQVTDRAAQEAQRCFYLYILLVKGAAVPRGAAGHRQSRRKQRCFYLYIWLSKAPMKNEVSLSGHVAPTP